VRTVTYLYDAEGWALHNVGLSLQRAAIENRWPFDVRLAHVEGFLNTPWSTDVLCLSYLGLFNAGFPYRTWAGELICTVHDPSELSSFTNTFDWKEYPLKGVSLGAFDRVSATSQEVCDTIQRAFGVITFRTPTFPHTNPTSDIIRLSETDSIVRFTSSTRGKKFASASELYWRLRGLSAYLRDSNGCFNASLLRSVFILTNRKNIAELERVGRVVQRAGNGQCAFSTGAGSLRSHTEYLAELASSDVYVCTSYMEGGPLPVMEAVLSGLAVISSPVGQVEDWVEHGRSGYICRSSRDFEAAALAYLRNPALLREHQARAIEIGAQRRFAASEWLAFLNGDQVIRAESAE
jgi:hypothetical protein